MKEGYEGAVISVLMLLAVWVLIAIAKLFF
jgi:hypothetical protein